MKKTQWLTKLVLPVHLGSYEVRLEKGKITRASFTEEGWSCDSRLFTHWRGMNVALRKSAIKKRRAVLAKYAVSPKHRRRAAAAALKLARHAVGTGKSALTRSLCYEIAVKLGAGLDADAADHVQRLQAGKGLSQKERGQVAAELKKLDITSLLPTADS